MTMGHETVEFTANCLVCPEYAASPQASPELRLGWMQP
jgi:hypothetical protein